MELSDSDLMAVKVNRAVKNLRYLFVGAFEFSWLECESAHEFEINALKIAGESVLMGWLQKYPFSYEQVQAMNAEQISGQVFGELSRAEGEGFGGE